MNQLLADGLAASARDLKKSRILRSKAQRLGVFANLGGNSIIFELIIKRYTSREVFFSAKIDSAVKNLKTLSFRINFQTKKLGKAISKIG